MYCLYLVNIYVYIYTHMHYFIYIYTCVTVTMYITCCLFIFTCLHCRGTFDADASLKSKDGILPDSFLAMPAWSKGVLFLNGFNLGWYWPSAGPQMTMYIPGPMLQDGQNELILFEVEASPKEASGVLPEPSCHINETDRC